MFAFNQCHGTSITQPPIYLPPTSITSNHKSIQRQTYLARVPQFIESISTELHICHSSRKRTNQRLNQLAIDSRHTLYIYCRLRYVRGSTCSTGRTMLCEERYSLLFLLTIPRRCNDTATRDAIRSLARGRS